MTCAVTHPLMKIATIDSVTGHYFKINGRGQMLDLNYQSGTEISSILGLRARVDVTYLRGTPHNGAVYHGVINIQCQSAPPSRTEILETLAASQGVMIVHGDVDTLSRPRGTEVLVIEEGLAVSATTIQVTVLSFTPEINFPQNEAAIRYLARG